ncbi:uncharacterized protein LOC116953843 isoform X2 [Petromyzon marinus]|uniref:uncharacterized protein LOC116953843 isoform X2 n=1 Tax=Petromyzon marinus TaxID=7757 RepID=UPI003F70261D
MRTRRGVLEQDEDRQPRVDAQLPPAGERAGTSWTPPARATGAPTTSRAWLTMAASRDAVADWEQLTGQQEPGFLRDGGRGGAGDGGGGDGGGGDGGGGLYRMTVTTVETELLTTRVLVRGGGVVADFHQSGTGATCSFDSTFPTESPLHPGLHAYSGAREALCAWLHATRVAVEQHDGCHGDVADTQRRIDALQAVLDNLPEGRSLLERSAVELETLARGGGGGGGGPPHGPPHGPPAPGAPPPVPPAALEEAERTLERDRRALGLVSARAHAALLALAQRLQRLHRSGERLLEFERWLRGVETALGHGAASGRPGEEKEAIASAVEALLEDINQHRPQMDEVTGAGDDTPVGEAVEVGAGGAAAAPLAPDARLRGRYDAALAAAALRAREGRVRAQLDAAWRSARADLSRFCEDVRAQLGAVDCVVGQRHELHARMQLSKRLLGCRDEGERLLASLLGAGRLVLRATLCPVERRAVQAALHDEQAAWDELHTSCVHAHGRLEWLYLQWRSYSERRTALLRALAAHVSAVDAQLLPQPSLADKEAALDRCREVDGALRVLGPALDELQEAARALLDRTEDAELHGDAERDALSAPHRDAAQRVQRAVVEAERRVSEHRIWVDSEQQLQKLVEDAREELSHLPPGTLTLTTLTPSLRDLHERGNAAVCTARTWGGRVGPDTGSPGGPLITRRLHALSREWESLWGDPAASPARTPSSAIAPSSSSSTVVASTIASTVVSVAFTGASTGASTNAFGIVGSSRVGDSVDLVARSPIEPAASPARPTAPPGSGDIANITNIISSATNINKISNISNATNINNISNTSSTFNISSSSSGSIDDSRNHSSSSRIGSGMQGPASAWTALGASGSGVGGRGARTERVPAALAAASPAVAAAAAATATAPAWASRRSPQDPVAPAVTAGGLASWLDRAEVMVGRIAATQPDLAAKRVALRAHEVLLEEARQYEGAAVALGEGAAVKDPGADALRQRYWRFRELLEASTQRWRELTATHNDFQQRHYAFRTWLSHGRRQLQDTLSPQGGGPGTRTRAQAELRGALHECRSQKKAELALLLQLGAAAAQDTSAAGAAKIRAWMREMRQGWDSLWSIHASCERSERGREGAAWIAREAGTAACTAQPQTEVARVEAEVTAAPEQASMVLRYRKPPPRAESSVLTRDKRGRWCAFVRRVLKAAVPFLLLLLLLALLVLLCWIPAAQRHHSCSLANNLARSFQPMLTYTNGPPPT